MKPYLGIILDSFWEVTSSRVFWALLLASTLILVAIAPFGLVVERQLSLSSVDLVDPPRLITKLARGLDRRGSPALSAIAERLSHEFADKVRRQVRDKEALIGPAELVEELNQIIKMPNLYSKEAFPTADKRQRLVELIRRSETGLTKEETRLLNRELLLIALTPEITTYRGEQVWVGYAGFKIGTPLAVTHRQVKTYVEPLMLQLMVQFGLGVMIVFIAIIVTSPIIPETFRAGNLYLLLSKPISRTWLFLSKFLGGCIFVSLNLVYILVGLYVIVGWRFEIWNSGLLACIPLLLFVYIVLYSVSALAGLIWGNAIVSVISVIIFWVFFFAVGTMHDVLQMRVEQWSQLHSVSEMQGDVFSVTDAGNLGVWDPQFDIWRPATEISVRAEGSRALTFGPFEDESHGQFLAKTFVPRSMDLTLLRPSRGLTMMRWDDRLPSPSTREQARSAPVWNALSGPEIPEQVFRIVQVGRQLIVVSRLGLFRLDLDRTDWQQPQSQTWLGFFRRGAFEQVTPSGFRISDNTTAVPVGEDGLFLYTDGSLTILQLEGARFRIRAQVALDGDGSEVALLAAKSDIFAVARENMPVEVFDAQLQRLAQFELPDGEKPKQIGWIPKTQRLIVLLHSGHLLEWNIHDSALKRVPLPVKSRVTCMNLQNAQRIWLGVIPNHAVCIDWSDASLVQSLVPVPTHSERFYYRIIRPLYRFNPKPSALNQSMHYLLTGEKTFDPQFIPVRLDTAQVELEPWQPIVSNLAFVICMLTASCLYLSWKEF